VPPARACADPVAVGPGDLELPRRDRTLADGPADRRPGHRRAEEVARGDVDVDGVAREARRVVADDVDQELRRAVLGDLVVRRRMGLPLPVAPAVDHDLVVTERNALGETDRAVRGAEGAARAVA